MPQRGDYEPAGRALHGKARVPSEVTKGHRHYPALQIQAKGPRYR